MTRFFLSSIGLGILATASLVACSDARIGESTAQASSELNLGIGTGPITILPPPVDTIDPPIGTVAPPVGTVTPPQVPAAGGSKALYLGGVFAGWVASADGGNASADVVTSTIGNDGVARKHLGPVKYGDITVSSGAGLSKDFYAWISSSLAPSTTAREDGAIVAADYNGKATSELDFFHGLITEVGFPALDAGSKDTGSLRVKVTPDTTRSVSPSLAPPSSAAGAGQRPKVWLTSNYRISLGGLDTSRVSRIQPLTFTRKVTTQSVGNLRTTTTVPQNLEVSNLVVSVPAAYASSWAAWHKSFVIDGVDDASQEKTGSIQILASDMQTVLFTVSLAGCGIFKLESLPVGTDAIAKVQASLYCDTVTFDGYGASN